MNQRVGKHFFSFVLGSVSERRASKAGPHCALCEVVEPGTVLQTKAIDRTAPPPESAGLKIPSLGRVARSPWVGKGGAKPPEVRPCPRGTLFLPSVPPPTT